MKPALRARPSVRDKVDFFNDHAVRAGSSSRERTSRTPTRQTSEELLNQRTPPLSYAASSGHASSEFDRNLRYDSEDEYSDLRSVPSIPSLPSRSQRPSYPGGEPPPPPTSSPPAPPQKQTYTTVTGIVSSVQQSPVSPPPQPQMPPQPAIREERDEAAPPLDLDRTSGLLLIADTPKGRLVRASRRIPSRTVIEVCPVLVLDPAEVQAHFSKTLLHNYTYNWPSRDERSGRTVQTQALPLGLGSLFNHSNHLWKCNVGWTRNVSAAGGGGATTVLAPSAPTNGHAGSFSTFDSFASSMSSAPPSDKDRRQIAGNDSITYTALRDIGAGEELCISYGPAERLTFVDVEAEREAAEAAEAARRERDEEERAAAAARSRGARNGGVDTGYGGAAAQGRGADAGAISPLENLWVDVDALDIYSRIDNELGG